MNRLLTAALGSAALSLVAADAMAQARNASVAGPGRPIPYTELQAASRSPGVARRAVRSPTASTGRADAATSTAPDAGSGAAAAAARAAAPAGDTAGTGGDMGVAPGSARLGEPGATSMGPGSSGGSNATSMTAGQPASGLEALATPPGSPPQR